MHHFLCTTVVALLGACTLPALATTEPQATQRIEITAPRGALAAAKALVAERGEVSRYELSNGRMLAVTPQGDGLEMRYGRRLSQAFKHDGQGNFVSRDGSVTMQFDVDARGQTQLVRLTAPANWF